MYPAFIDESSIPLSLIHPRWFFDGPDSLEQPWTMSYSHDQEFTYAFLPNATTNSPAALEPDLPQEVTVTEAQYERHAGDQYRNHGQNLTLNVALEAVEKQKEFSGAAAEEFARIFKTQTAEIVDAVEAREKRRKTLLPQLPLPLKEPKLRSFPSKNGIARKMTGTEAAIAAEADKTRARRKAEKQLEIKAKYEAELAALDADSSPPQLKPLFSLPSTTPPRYPVFSQSETSHSTQQAPVLVVSSDSDSDSNSEVSDRVGQKSLSASKNPSLSPSPTPRVSARNRKPTRKIESQRRRAAEEESEPKKKKIRKAKLVDATSQLKELLGSDIEFSA